MERMHACARPMQPVQYTCAHLVRRTCEWLMRWGMELLRPVPGYEEGRPLASLAAMAVKCTQGGAHVCFLCDVVQCVCHVECVCVM